MPALEYHDDCTSAADAKARAKRIAAWRREGREIRPVAEPQFTYVPPAAYTSPPNPAPDAVIDGDPVAPVVPPAVPDTPPTPAEVLFVADVITLTAAKFNVPRRLIMEGNRERWIVVPRHVAMYLARMELHRSWCKIADVFRKDHATVIYAARTIKSWLDTGVGGISEAVEELKTELRALALARPRPISMPPNEEPPAPKARQKWTAADLEILRQTYGRENRSMREVASLLGRTPHAIDSKAHRIGAAAKKPGPRRRVR